MFRIDSVLFVFRIGILKCSDIWLFIEGEGIFVKVGVFESSGKLSIV